MGVGLFELGIEKCQISLFLNCCCGFCSGKDGIVLSNKSNSSFFL